MTSINQKLTYLERRAEEQGLDGANLGRHLAGAIVNCQVHGQASFRICFCWMQKELTECMQRLQKAESARGAKLTLASWGLVLEAAFREALAMSVKKNKRGYWTKNSHSYRLIVQKIAWCRTMRWMEGAASGDTQELNVVTSIANLGEDRHVHGEDDLVPNLHKAMWRTADLNPRGEALWEDAAMQSFNVEFDAMQKNYNDYVDRIVEKRLKAGEDGNVAKKQRTRFLTKKREVEEEDSDLESTWGNDDHEAFIAERMQSIMKGESAQEYEQGWTDYSAEKSEDDKKQQ